MSIWSQVLAGGSHMDSRWQPPTIPARQKGVFLRRTNGAILSSPRARDHGGDDRNLTVGILARPFPRVFPQSTSIISCYSPMLLSGPLLLVNLDSDSLAPPADAGAAESHCHVSFTSFESRATIRRCPGRWKLCSRGRTVDDNACLVGRSSVSCTEYDGAVAMYR